MVTVRGVLDRFRGALLKGLIINNPFGAFWRWGSERVWSGMEVNEQTAMHVAAYFAGVRVITEDIAKLPFIVYREGPNGQRDRATDSPFWELIHERPNPSMTSQQLREYLTGCAINRGNGYALKVGPRNQTQQLIPLHPDNVTPELQPDFSLVYKVRHLDGTEDNLTRERVFHLPGLSLDGYLGVSVIEYAKQTLGNARAANRHAGTFFGRGLHASGMLSVPDAPQATLDSIKEQAEAKASGENTNSLLVVNKAMTYTPVSINARDSQFLESRTFEVLEVCRWLRLKPHKIAELTRATFSNIEQESQEHVTDTLMPWGQRWQDAINQQVLAGTGYKAELLYDALLRGTTKERYEAYQMAGGGNAPFMTRNEIRRRENLPPLEGLDTILVPMNMAGGEGQQGGQDNV
jgi:HK97 family phage portal protein